MQSLEAHIILYETLESSVETEAMPPLIATRGRQRAGVACDECRRRKLRCDGQQPECGVCQGSGSVCEVTQRGVRGPKKGYVKALKSRLVHLEAMLESRPSPDQQQQQRPGSENSSGITPPTLPVEVLDAVAIDCTQSWLPVGTASVSAAEILPSDSFLPGLGSSIEWSLASELPLVSNPIRHITDATQAEL